LQEIKDKQSYELQHVKEKFETDSKIQNQIIEKIKSENKICNHQLSEMNTSYSQSNLAIDKVIEKLRKFFMKQYGSQFDDLYVKCREIKTKSELILPLCELLMLSNFNSSDCINLLSLKFGQLIEPLERISGPSVVSSHLDRIFGNQKQMMR
jgi:tRNA U34 5-carboxymethylaminomethyl modifying GTPase MnmE/TrmE